MLPLRKKHLKQCYCAFCRSERRISLQKHIGLYEIGLSALGAVLLSFLFYQSLQPQALVFLGVSLSLLEFFVQFKYRLAIACPHCGFDPLLYIKSREKACEQVKQHLERRKNDPYVLLSPRAKLDLPVIVKKQDGKPVPSPHKARNLDLKL